MEASNASDNSVAAAMVALVKCSSDAGPNNNMMRIYLDKLKDLVPHCPKNRELTKLELIQHVIDYINDLQDTLQGGAADADSPPSSPGPDPMGFTEAFSHLTFGDQRGALMDPSKRGVPSSGEAAAYTSDGSSDYDSRGSSPVSHHSDVDYCSSSDEFPPSGALPHPLFVHHSGGAFYQHPPQQHFAVAPAPVCLPAPSVDPYRRFLRKDFQGPPTYHPSS